MSKSHNGNSHGAVKLHFRHVKKKKYSKKKRKLRNHLKLIEGKKHKSFFTLLIEREKATEAA